MTKPLRSRLWFYNPSNPDMTALYLERYLNQEYTRGELQGNRWGLLSLQLSRWLLQRGWTVGRNARGERQGKAPLGNWLPTLLAEEAEGLRLKHYQQFPEALAEQLPRIERLLA